MILQYACQQKKKKKNNKKLNIKKCLFADNWQNRKIFLAVGLTHAPHNGKVPAALQH